MDIPLRTIRPNIVQSIRAFRVSDLQDAAQTLGHRFLYANLANAQTKQEVLDLINQQFKLMAQVGKNFDALYDSMTDPVHKSGPQPGFIAVLEHIPANAKFDKEAREQLLDVFRDTADYWGDRKVPFRCFYSFSVARSAHVSPVERLSQGASTSADPVGGITTIDPNEKLPTDKLLDISPLALRMSSPFNAGYWQAGV
ncbi:MAG: barstar family protein [Rhodoferax sp.]|nr:barstar family protein [Rhodoferax sp.]